jgi:hypothetical protein
MAAIVLGCHQRSQLLSGRWRASFLQRQPFLPLAHRGLSRNPTSCSGRLLVESRRQAQIHPVLRTQSSGNEAWDLPLDAAAVIGAAASLDASRLRTAHHPTEPILTSIANGRRRASGAVPAEEAKRPVSDRSGDLRWSVQRRRPRAETSRSSDEQNGQGLGPVAVIPLGTRSVPDPQSV